MIEVATKHVYCFILLTISGAKNNARISPADIFTDYTFLAALILLIVQVKS